MNEDDKSLTIISRSRRDVELAKSSQIHACRSTFVKFTKITSLPCNEVLIAVLRGSRQGV
jgi:hypothetical protein